MNSMISHDGIPPKSDWSIIMLVTTGISTQKLRVWGVQISHSSSSNLHLFPHSFCPKRLTSVDCIHRLGLGWPERSPSSSLEGWCKVMVESGGGK